jgi:hypothetical protein
LPHWRQHRPRRSSSSPRPLGSCSSRRRCTHSWCTRPRRRRFRRCRGRTRRHKHRSWCRRCRRCKTPHWPL